MEGGQSDTSVPQERRHDPLFRKGRQRPAQTILSTGISGTFWISAFGSREGNRFAGMNHLLQRRKAQNTPNEGEKDNLELK